MALHAGDAVPHFDVTTVDGRQVRYREIWQRYALIAVSLPASTSAAQHMALAETIPDQTRLVITHDVIPGLPQPGALVADQWGEIAFVSAEGKLPPPAELLEWLEHVRMKCPECEGETR